MIRSGILLGSLHFTEWRDHSYPVAQLRICTHLLSVIVLTIFDTVSRSHYCYKLLWQMARYRVENPFLFEA